MDRPAPPTRGPHLRKSGTSRSSFSSKVTVRGGVCAGRAGSTGAWLRSVCTAASSPLWFEAGTGSGAGRRGLDRGGGRGGCRAAGAAAAAEPRRPGRAALDGAERPVVGAVDRGATVEAGRDDGDPHLVAEGVVDDRTEDDVRLGVRGLLDQSRGLVDLEEPEVAAALDREQHAVGAVDARLEQRAGDRQLGGLHRAVLAAGRADAHERGPGSLHHRLDVGEVEVDQAGRGDEVGDPLDTGEQHLVGGAERVEHRHPAVADRQQPVVGDDDEGVDLLAQGARCRSRPGWRGGGPRR